MNIKELLLRLLVLLKIIKIPKTDISDRWINGFVVFQNELKSNLDFDIMINSLYKMNKNKVRNGFIRIPMPKDMLLMPNYIYLINRMINAKLTPIALLDTYNNYNITKQRLYSLINDTNIRYIEIFNELPHMTYIGEQFKSFNDCFIAIRKIYEYIKSKNKNIKVISMSPVNICQEIYHDEWKIYNYEILKSFLVNDVSDIISVHCYINSIKETVRLLEMIDYIKKHNMLNKPIWITEIGCNNQDKQIDFFEEKVALANKLLNPQATIWYRLFCKKNDDIDKDYAIIKTFGDSVVPNKFYDYLILNYK